MTPWDRKLIRQAAVTPYWNYKLVFEFVDMADTDEAKYKLNSSAELLFEVYKERGYYDPNKEKSVQGVWQRIPSLFRRIVQKLLAKRESDVYKTEV